MQPYQAIRNDESLIYWVLWVWFRWLSPIWQLAISFVAAKLAFAICFTGRSGLIRLLVLNSVIVWQSNANFPRGKAEILEGVSRISTLYLNLLVLQWLRFSEFEMCALVIFLVWAFVFKFTDTSMQCSLSRRCRFPHYKRLKWSADRMCVELVVSANINKNINAHVISRLWGGSTGGIHSFRARKRYHVMVSLCENMYKCSVFRDLGISCISYRGCVSHKKRLKSGYE